MSEPGRQTRSLLDRWWVRLLVAAWIIAVIVVYFQRQVQRILELAGALR
jgi:hypothetical protein